MKLPPAVILNSPPTYIAFAYILLVGVLCAFAKGPLLVVAALVFFFIALFWLCQRFPRTMIFILAFISGLLGGGRRRW